MKYGIWATLDCDPTTDRGTIRRAYAARLKAMDVDADPDGFAALRDARDAALARAADPDAAVAVEPVVADESPAPEPEREPEVDALAEAMNAHFHALEALLFPGHDAPSTPDELADIAHHGSALLADPRLEQVDFAAGAERWFAETLAASVPRSDPLLEPAAAAFGWIDRRNDYALSADAQAIVERIGATRFVALLDDPRHRFHRAWRELNRSGARRGVFRNPMGPRRDLLKAIRDRFPIAEGWLDPQRVAEVDAAKPRTGFSIWMAIIAITVALRIVAAIVAAPDAPPGISYSADPNVIARDVAGLDLEGVAAINPDLADAIRTTAFGIHSKRDERSGQAIRELSRSRLPSGLARADDALLRDIARFEIDAKQAIAVLNPPGCGELTFPADDGLLTWNTRPRQQPLLHRVMLASDGRPTRFDDRFRVSGKTIADMLRHTDLPEDRLRGALSLKGTPGDVCSASIALRKSALAQGKAGMAILRAMQPKVIDAPNGR
ncbi:MULTISPECIES: hypothetical protein [unclassified Sphingomonas]|uniref:hypothetical protein n=1 Tax=unclassified Sphingomonas TaxID=196159 RepID=UPI0007014F85|nr:MULTISPECIES: hypothetical protein [unclassified Sphingomonas]KQM27646.1 hypothetical protein ASE58_04575 [Sphingomonas sp. Leaf9]KQM43986.1 hypothetical protein ASE57_04570 [Sphingomonas sp. Leaf11]